MKIDIHGPEKLVKFGKDFRNTTIDIAEALKVCYEYLQIGQYNAKVDKVINTKLLAKYNISVEAWEDPYETFRYYFTYKNDDWNVSVIAKGWEHHGVYIYGSDDKDVPPDKSNEMIDAFNAIYENVETDLKNFIETYSKKVKEREEEEENERWVKGE